MGQGSFTIYHQTQSVARNKNPPSYGHFRFQNNRDGGYATYRVGKWYIDPFELCFQWGTRRVDGPNLKPIAISVWEAWTQNIRMIKAEQQEVLRCTRDRIEAEIDQLKIKLITQNNAG